MTQNFLYHSGKRARFVHIIVASEFGNFKLSWNLLQRQILFTPVWNKYYSRNYSFT